MVVWIQRRERGGQTHHAVTRGKLESSSATLQPVGSGQNDKYDNGNDTLTQRFI